MNIKAYLYNINLFNKIIITKLLNNPIPLEALQLRQGEGEVRAGLPAAAKDRLLDRRNSGTYGNPGRVKSRKELKHLEF